MIFHRAILPKMVTIIALEGGASKTKIEDLKPEDQLQSLLVKSKYRGWTAGLPDAKSTRSFLQNEDPTDLVSFGVRQCILARVFHLEFGLFYKTKNPPIPRLLDSDDAFDKPAVHPLYFKFN